MPRIVFKGRIDFYTGWGQQLCHLIQFCIGAGYEVIVLAESVNEPFTSVIPKAVKDRIVKGVVGGGCFWKATHLEGNASGDKNMIYSTVWESDTVAPQSVRCINMAKCLVVPSQFCADAAPRSGITIPVRIVPHGTDKTIYRYQSPIGTETCVFGSAGRLAHGPRRKGLAAVIEAFLEAFPSEEDVFLKLKTFSDCKLQVPTDPRIEVTTRFLSEPDVAKWLASLTCFVSAAKGEGWGLWQHQALSVGRPLICAKYGGPDMFVTERNSFIVDHTIVPAEEGRYAGHWCEPSHASMVEQMRTVYENRREAAARGRIGSLETGHLTLERAGLEAVKVMEEFGFDTKELMASTEDARIRMHGAVSTPRHKPVRTHAQPRSRFPDSATGIPPGTVWAGGVTKELVFRGRLDTFTGYGQQFIPIMEAFLGMGFEVTVRATGLDESFTSVVPQRIKQRAVKDVPQPNEWEWQMLPLGPHDVTKGKKVIYHTMWEADGITPQMAATLNQCVCVVTSCKWNADAFKRCGVTVPIRIVPLGIDRHTFRYRLPRPNSTCTFGAAGRLGHGRVRKGLDQIIQAFKLAFPTEKDVRLDLKCFSDDHMEDDTDPRIHVNTSYLSDSACSDWLSSLTAFVGFWRGEGWGLWQHKASSVGRPIVGPLYSGPTEFMDESNSFPVAFTTEPASEFQQGSGNWCCPDLASLVEQMQNVYRNRDQAEAKGIAASVSAGRFTLERTAIGVLGVMTEFGMLAQTPTKKVRELIFKHSGDWGDVIFALPVIRALGGGILYLSEDGRTRQLMTPERAEKLAGLLHLCPYIKGLRYGKPHYCDYDLDTFRNIWKVDPKRKLGLYECQAQCWGLNGKDITAPKWLTVDHPVVVTGKPVVVCRTARYHQNPDRFPWSKVAEKYRDKAVFIGFEDEHKALKKHARWPELERVETRNFLEIARVLSGAKLFIGNQSGTHAVAEGLKMPIIQETCTWDPSAIFLRENVQNVWNDTVTLPDI